MVENISLSYDEKMKIGRDECLMKINLSEFISKIILKNVEKIAQINPLLSKSRSSLALIVIKTATSCGYFLAYSCTSSTTVIHMQCQM